MWLWLLAGAVLTTAAAARPAAADQPNGGSAEDKAAIAKNAEGFIEAFQKGDAQAVAAFWAPDGDYTDETGRHMKGRGAIEKAFTKFFSENKGLKVRIDSLALRFVTPDVAIEDGTSSVIGPDGGPPSRARYSIVHVKKDGQWQLSSVRDSVYVAPSNQGHLSGLEALIGDWASEGDKGEAERLSVTWGPNENFVIATFARTSGAVTLGSATQWIGWDPAEKRVRSWIFDAAGGFGEGSWTRDGKSWVIKTTSTLQDGKKGTATYVVTEGDADTIGLQAKDRSVDGKGLPDTAEVKLKRVK
jgi:uncharacterized protein (TIGR02246 family)